MKQEETSSQAKIAEYRRRLRSNPKDIEVRIQLGMAYRESGDYAAAMGIWKSVLESDPSNQLAKRLIVALEADLRKVNFTL